MALERLLTDKESSEELTEVIRMDSSIQDFKDSTTIVTSDDTVLGGGIILGAKRGKTNHGRPSPRPKKKHNYVSRAPSVKKKNQSKKEKNKKNNAIAAKRGKTQQGSENEPTDNFCTLKTGWRVSAKEKFDQENI